MAAAVRRAVDHGALTADARFSPGRRYYGTYLPAGAQWQRWSSTRNIVLAGGANTGNPATSAGVTGAGDARVDARYIKAGYFSLVALNFTDTTSLDRQIAADLRRNPHYHQIQVVPYGSEIPRSTWAATSSGSTSRPGRRADPQARTASS